MARITSKSISNATPADNLKKATKQVLFCLTVDVILFVTESLTITEICRMM